MYKCYMIRVNRTTSITQNKKKNILGTIFRKNSVFICTIKVQPVLVKIFVFGVQSAHCFFTQAKRTLACHRVAAKV